MNKLCMAARLRYQAWIIMAFIWALIINCTSENNQLQISFEGKSYSYEKIQYIIKDIETEPINTRWVKTDNCIIQYSKEYEDYLGNMISYSEEGFKRVSADLRYNSNNSKLQIWFLNNTEFKRLSRATSGAIAIDDNGGVAIINVDKHKFAENAYVVTHEIAHIIFYRISGTSYRVMLKEHSQYAQSFHSFSEALAQTEDQSRGPVDKSLFLNFPNLNFLPLERIDTQKYTGDNYRASIVEMRALIKFIKEKWGQDTLVEIVRTVGNHGLARAIEKCTNMPIDQFQSTWFSYMTDMLDDYKKNNP